jgi:hypothetical protein
MIEILKYSHNMNTQWDQFISDSFNGTIFHKRKFLAYHIDRVFDDCSLIFKKRDKIIAVLPAAIINNKQKIFFSHPGASFGGVIHKNLSFNDCTMVLDLINEFFVKNNFDSIFMVQTPTIYNTHNQNEIVDYTLKFGNYKNIENYISNILLIEHDVKNQLIKIAKNKNRTIGFYDGLIQEYDLQFRWVDDFDDFYPILIENKKKHDSKPTHSKKELEALKAAFPNDVLQLMLYYKNIPIGGMTIFKANTKGAILFYSMLNYEYNKMQPIPLLMHYIIQWAKANDLVFIDYGISHMPQAENPLAPSKSLIKFKEEFGCFGIIRNAYNKIINE